MEQVINWICSGLISLIAAIFGGLGDFLKELMNPKPDTALTAEFMPAGELCSRHHHGFCITGLKSLTIGQSYSNCSVYGPSGSGKSTSVTIATVFSLAQGGSSMYINDPSAEVYTACSGYLESIGYVIHRLDFSNPEFDSFNCLAACKTVSDVQRVAQLLISNTQGGYTGGDPFWRQSSEMLITLFARYLLFHSAPEYRTMANVLRLLECFAVTPKRTDMLFAYTRDPELLSAYSAVIVMGEKTLQSVIATTRSSLSIFSDPCVARTTARDTIDLSSLRQEPVAVFVTNPIQYTDYYKALSALFFQAAFNQAMSYIPARDQRSIFFILDEGASMRFTSLSVTISNIRKYKAGIMLLVQDYMSLVALYGQAEAHNIRTNTFAQVYLKGQPLETCKELEAILGRYSYTDGSVERTRQLMTVDELRKSNDAIILCGNYAPMKVRMTQFFDRDSLRKYASIPPYQAPVNPLASQLPPMIPLP